MTYHATDTEILVIGTGTAGCAAALSAARAGAEVVLVSRASDPQESNTYYAQGGIVGRPPDDTAEALAADIESAGDLHPTALVHPRGRLLISEALRGEGARITDAAGRHFLRDFHPAGELAPRDVVARAIHRRMLDEDQPHVLLDISHKPAEWIRARFPGVYERCLDAGYDITKGPIPVVPAAHYACGGIAVDSQL